MKKLITIAAMTLVLTGCYSNSRNSGGPGNENGREDSVQTKGSRSNEPNDRGSQTRSSINLNSTLSK